MSTGPCDCAMCQKLCNGRPGMFAPAEVEAAALELGLTLDAFFEKYLTINWWGDDKDETGKEWDHIGPGWQPDRELLSFPFRVWAPTYRPSTVGRRCSHRDGFSAGKCALLGPDGCRLSFERRPEECRRAYGCDKSETGMDLHREVALKWLEPDGVALLERLKKFNDRGD